MQPRNPWLCFLIAGGVSLTGLACVVGIVIASATGHEPHASLSHIAATCVCSMASFLVVVPRGPITTGDPNPPSPSRAA